LSYQNAGIEKRGSSKIKRHIISAKNNLIGLHDPAQTEVVKNHPLAECIVFDENYKLEDFKLTRRNKNICSRSGTLQSHPITSNFWEMQYETLLTRNMTRFRCFAHKLPDHSQCYQSFATLDLLRMHWKKAFATGQMLGPNESASMSRVTCQFPGCLENFQSTNAMENHIRDVHLCM